MHALCTQGVIDDSEDGSRQILVCKLMCAAHRPTVVCTAAHSGQIRFIYGYRVLYVYSSRVRVRVPVYSLDYSTVFMNYILLCSLYAVYSLRTATRRTRNAMLSMPAPA